jgi:glycosyltransferase involved in cell wall biosynthesis
MKFILYSDIGEDAIRGNLGRPEYSYYFVLKAYRAVLEQLGEIVLVRDPVTEVDPIFDAAAEQGDRCIFISFSPPHKVAIGLRCPTIVVFAWEFSTIPDGGWDDDPRNDWRFVFAKLGHAISLSSFTARVVKEAMGPDYPIAAIAAPVWDRMARPDRREYDPIIADTELRISGTVFDTAQMTLSADSLLPSSRSPEPPPEPVAPPPPPPPPEPIIVIEPRKTIRYRFGATKRHMLEWYREVVRDLLPRWLMRFISMIGRGSETISRRLLDRRPPPPEPVELPVVAVVEPPPPPPEITVRVSGIVYTSVLNPTDGRKNWLDLVTAFCWAFRDVEDATLILKMVKHDAETYGRELLILLAQLSPFKCRIVALDGFLEDDQYAKLIAATTYYANASNAEGLCLPLMEFMACGKPAIAPRHTAMEDYIDAGAAFIVRSTLEHNVWPHDPRSLFTTMRQRIDWETLLTAYRDSYRVAKEMPARYAKMAERAADIMRGYSSDAAIKEQLGAFFDRMTAAGESVQAPLAAMQIMQREIAMIVAMPRVGEPETI